MTTDHIKMLFDISELNSLFVESTNIQTFLDRTVLMVSNHMLAEVCSIYVYDEKNDEVILKANKGLDVKSIDQVRMKLGEGIVGSSLKERRTICDNNAKKNPFFKFFPGIHEEDFDSFLAVPILRGKARIGVLVVQRKFDKPFNNIDSLALQTIASQLATFIENVKIFMNITSKDSLIYDEKPFKELKFIKGKIASEGFAYGKVCFLDSSKQFRDFANYKFNKKYDLNNFIDALNKTEKQIEDFQQKLEERLTDAALLIFTAHLLMLKDESFIGKMKKLIEQGENPPIAVLKVCKEYEDLFRKQENELLKEKIHDIHDLKRRIISNLVQLEDGNNVKNNDIIIAKDILPSELLKLSIEGVKGILLIGGGVTSHISILSRSLEIPVIISDNINFLYLNENDMLLLDAEIGNIYINPTNDIVESFEERNKSRKKVDYNSDFFKESTKTKDGTKINLLANINLLSDFKQINEDYIDGIGLYRTEFPFLIRNNFPSEEEQFAIYKKLSEFLKIKPLTIRTLDIGGDKILTYYSSIKENNPFLGMRSIRFSLSHIDIFKKQIRAILRACKDNNLRIMFPMISSLDEFLKAKNIVKECQNELKNQNIEFHESPKIGIMVEIPSLIPILDDIACEADFFSIGTNDLVQYMLAVDRTNERVADLYVPYHPAILKSLFEIVKIAGKHNIECSICGDVAHDVRLIPFLIGIGIQSLSVNPIFISEVKKTISDLTLDQAKEFAENLLSQKTIEKIKSLLYL